MRYAGHPMPTLSNSNLTSSCPGIVDYGETAGRSGFGACTHMRESLGSCVGNAISARRGPG